MNRIPAYHHLRPLVIQKWRHHTIVIVSTPITYDGCSALSCRGAMMSAYTITTGSAIGIHIMAYHESAGTGCLRHMNLPVFQISRR